MQTEIYFVHLISTSTKFYIIFLFNSPSGGSGVQTGSIRHVGHFWPIVPASGDCEDGEFSGMKIAGETEVLGENLPQHQFVHHKFYLTRPGLEPRPPRWEASD
jgi:hypothetical protein